MAKRNRVTPYGELEEHPFRGCLFMGNRGCLHDDTGRIVRHHVGRRWIVCVTSFKGRRRTLVQPGLWTELFFLDEATALAAGHRPCKECRREDYQRFARAWASAHGLALVRGDLPVATIDDALSVERQHTSAWEAEVGGLPDGVVVEHEEHAALVRDSRLWTWHHDGYTGPERTPTGRVRVLTPQSTVATIAAGYAPVLHPSAR
ncbi:MAG: hypothetical protein QOF97_2898 [Acidimicrobiaceae bacterium]